MMNSEISSKRNSSDYVSNYSESSNNQNDNLHFEKIKVNSEEESSNNNKSKIQPKISISNHISLQIKNNEDEKSSEKNRVIMKSDKQSESSNSNNSSSSKRIKFVESINNNFTRLYNLRRRLSSNSNRNSSINNSTSREINKNCLVCEEELNDQEKKDNDLECHHICCDDCYFDYLKEKVNTNQIERIRCQKKDCETILNNNFIERKLFRDIEILEKYKKLQKRRQLILDPNVQLCPYPDCESYAKKLNETNYVCCIHNKHKFCFNCLKEWHGKKKCDDSVDKSFNKWRDSYKVKRCPKCKFFIEKNEGCNHITCTNCNYEFCWLCLGKYSSNHFDLGQCAGLQYANCGFCSNRLFNFFYRFFMIILKCIAFAIVLPFAITFYIYYSFHHKCVHEYDDCCSVFFGICGTLSCLNFIMCGLVLSSFISVLMILIWPFHDWVFSLICN